jgi:hypothetical protein
MRKVVLSLASIAIVIVIGFSILGQFALSPKCELSELDTRSSPDGEIVASVFHKNCGATADYITGVALRRAGQSFTDESSNVVLVIEDTVSIEVRWAGDNKLEIGVSPAAPIFSKRDEWKNVSVELKYLNGK